MLNVEPGDIPFLQDFSGDPAFVTYVDTLIERLRDAASHKTPSPGTTRAQVIRLMEALDALDSHTLMLISLALGDIWIGKGDVREIVERLRKEVQSLASHGRSVGAGGRPMTYVGHEVLIAVDELKQWSIVEELDLRKLMRFAFRKAGIPKDAARHAVKTAVSKLEQGR